MMLNYFFLERYGILERLDVNFSDEFQVAFDREANEITIDLRESPRIDDFFGTGIAGITAIVGDNGAGKSTLLEALFGVLGHPNFTPIVIVGNTVLQLTNHESRLKIKGNCARRFDTKFITDPDKKYSVDPYVSHCLRRVYISEYLQKDRNQIGRGNHDYSLRRLLDSSVSQFSITNIYNVNGNLRQAASSTFANPSVEIFRTYHLEDFTRQLQMVDWCSKKGVHLPFEAEAMLTVEARVHFDYDRYMATSSSKRGILTPFLNSLQKSWTKLSIKGASDTHWLAYIKETICFELLRFLLVETYASTKRIPLPQENESYLETYEKVFKSMWRKHKSYPNSLWFEAPLLLAWVKQLNSDTIEVDVDSHYGVATNQAPSNLDRLSFKLKGKALTWLLLEHQSERWSFFRFGWGLSSGEWSFLNLLSKFWKASKEIMHEIEHPHSNSPDFQDVEPTMLIILDEPCLHFHPHWQRNFIKYLVDLLPKLNQSRLKCQVIFASHSPLTVADLPIQNVLILRRNENEEPKFQALSEDFNTFGGDPFTLYRKAFGIQDMYFSGFAREKMEKFFAPIIEERDFSSEEEDKMRKFALMVGDEAVRYKLLQLIDEKRQVE